MIDAHVHIERGPYSENWIDVFVERAATAGIDELYLLEHSFRFHNGLFINYGHRELGMNRELLRVLKQNGVHLMTASDAHRPEDVGRYIKEAEGIMREGCA